MPGALITFEGIGGSGKSTITARLVAWLQERHLPVVATREPGGTQLGHELRGLVLGPERRPAPWTEAFLFEADRAQTYAEVILPALVAGKIVVSDRNLYGTVAYQAFGRGLDLALVDQMTQAATQGASPDLAFVLDLDPADAMARKRGQVAADRFDQEDLAFQERARQGFLFAANRDGPRARILDATKPVDEIFADVRATVAELLARRGPGPTPR